MNLNVNNYVMNYEMLRTKKRSSIIVPNISYNGQNKAPRNKEKKQYLPFIVSAGVLAVIAILGIRKGWFKSVSKSSAQVKDNLPVSKVEELNNSAENVSEVVENSNREKTLVEKLNNMQKEKTQNSQENQNIQQISSSNKKVSIEDFDPTKYKNFSDIEPEFLEIKNDKGVVIQTVEPVYCAGNQFTINTFNPDKPEIMVCKKLYIDGVETIVSKFDNDSGKILSQVHCDNKGNKLYEAISKYADNTVTETRSYYKEGVLYQEWVLLNEKDCMLKHYKNTSLEDMTYYFPKGTRKTIIFNKSNNKIDEVVISDSNNRKRVKIKYADDGRAPESIYNKTEIDEEYDLQYKYKDGLYHVEYLEKNTIFPIEEQLPESRIPKTLEQVYQDLDLYNSDIDDIGIIIK